jgi:hypothetical protein
LNINLFRNTTHRNILIFDNHFQTIYHFEPNGLFTITNEAMIEAINKSGDIIVQDLINWFNDDRPVFEDSSLYYCLYDFLLSYLPNYKYHSPLTFYVSNDEHTLNYKDYLTYKNPGGICELLCNIFLYNLCEEMTYNPDDQYLISQCSTNWYNGIRNIVNMQSENRASWILNIGIVLSQYTFKTISHLFDLFDNKFRLDVSNIHNRLRKFYEYKGIAINNRIYKIKLIDYLFTQEDFLTLIITLNDDQILNFDITDTIQQYTSEDRLLIEIAKLFLFVSDYSYTSSYLRIVSDYFNKPDYGKSFKLHIDECKQSA